MCLCVDIEVGMHHAIKEKFQKKRHLHITNVFRTMSGGLLVHRPHFVESQWFDWCERKKGEWGDKENNNIRERKKRVYY